MAAVALAAAVVLVAAVVLAGCGDGRDGARAMPSGKVASGAVPGSGAAKPPPPAKVLAAGQQSAESGGPGWYRLPDDTPRPSLLEDVDVVAYRLANGRTLWVEESSGIGRVFGDPGMSADQWSCDSLLGAGFVEDTRDIPNFTGLVCYPADAHGSTARATQAPSGADRGLERVTGIEPA